MHYCFKSIKYSKLILVSEEYIFALFLVAAVIREQDTNIWQKEGFSMLSLENNNILPAGYQTCLYALICCYMAKHKPKLQKPCSDQKLL